MSNFCIYIFKTMIMIKIEKMENGDDFNQNNTSLLSMNMNTITDMTTRILI